MILISDGLDLSNQSEEVNPDVSTQISRAIREAQNRNVAVFAAYVSVTQSAAAWSSRALAPPNVDFGPVSLVKVSDETGGEAFIGPPGAVSLAAYWTELKEMMDGQWLLTYQSTNSGKGFRRIKVSTGNGLRLSHQAGYRVD